MLLSRFVHMPRFAGVIVAMWAAFAPVLESHAQSLSDAVQQRRGVSSVPLVDRSETLTRLSDGSWFISGGFDSTSGKASNRASIISTSATAEVQVLAQQMSAARVGHSATVLPDGNVLILGGVGVDAEVHNLVEVFSPSSGAFKRINTTTLLPRAYHTATLMADGRMLIAGGIGSTRAGLPEAELLDTLTGVVERFNPRLDGARVAHIAALTWGRVTLTGGFDAQRVPLISADVFDASTLRFERVANSDSGVTTSDRRVRVVGTLPASGSRGIDRYRSVAVQFSSPLRHASASAATVHLLAGITALPARVTVAEGGLLMFVQPSRPLQAETPHRLVLDGIEDASGTRLRPFTLEFETGGTAASTGVPSLANLETLSDRAPEQNNSAPINASANALSVPEPKTAAPASSAKLLDPQTLTNVQRTQQSSWVSFEQNSGQEPELVRFTARGPGYRAFFTANEVVIRLRDATQDDRKKREEIDRLTRELVQTKKDTDYAKTHQIRRKLHEHQKEHRRSRALRGDSVLRIQDLGARPPQFEAGALRSTKVHYLIGNDARKWRRDVPQYSMLKAVSVYPGIDALYFGKQTSIERDWIVHPGADPRQIQTRYVGARSVSIDANGDLIVALRNQQLRKPKPTVYQEIDGRPQLVSGKYKLIGDAVVGYEIGDYDQTRTLIIDPTVVGGANPQTDLCNILYTTGTGSGGGGSAARSPVDPGASHLTCDNNTGPSSPAPGVNPDARPIPPGTTTPDRPANAVYAAYLGDVEICGSGIKADGAGSLYIFGSFPLEGFGAGQPAAPSGSTRSLGVAKLSPDGRYIEHISYLGTSSESCSVDSALGSTDDLGYFLFTGSGFGVVRPGGRSIALDTNGDVLIAATTSAAAGLPNTQHLISALGSAPSKKQAFVSKISGDGAQVRFSAYVGGINANTYGTGLALDAAGDIYLTGATFDQAFSTVNGLRRSFAGGRSDAFVARIRGDGRQVVYTSLLGGGAVTNNPNYLLNSDSFYDVGHQVAVDRFGSVYVLGYTTTADFPTTSGALYGVNLHQSPGSSDFGGISSFLTRIDPTGQSVQFSTFLPATNDLLVSGDSIYLSGVDYRDSAYSTRSCIRQLNLSGELQSCIPGFVYWTNLQLQPANDGKLFVSGTWLAEETTRLLHTGEGSLRPDWAVEGGAYRAGTVGLAKVDPANATVEYQGILLPTVPEFLDRNLSGLTTDAAGNAYVGLKPTAFDYPLTSSFGGPYPTLLAAGSSGTAPVVSGSGELVLKLSSAASPVTLISDFNPSEPGQAVIFTAKVKGNSPTGAVTFRNGSKIIGAVQLDANANAQISYVFVEPGNYGISAAYSGDAYNEPALSLVLNQDVRLIGAPKVLLNEPVDGGVVLKPENLIFKASVESDLPVAYVEYIADGKLLARQVHEEGVPWSFTWADPPLGDKSVWVRATNIQGLTVDSKVAKVSVVDRPSIQVTAPLNGANVAVGVTIPLRSKTVGLNASVQYFVNDVAIAVFATDPPFQVTWLPQAPGNYKIVAVGKDAAGNTYHSEPVYITAGQQQRETITYLHNDAAGSPIFATDAQGNVLWRETYAPYGERLIQAAAAAQNPQWFHGKAQDSETGLQYFGARYYDPALGRFMGVDTVQASDHSVHAFNRYSFANNNPSRFTDPDGNSPLDVAFLAVDVGMLGYAIYKGEGAGAAAVDVGLSLLGVLSPLPGTGQALKAVKAVDRAADTVRAAEHAAMAAEKAVVKAEQASTKAASKADTHHICTNKNCVSPANGGPWTPRFEKIFAKAGMTLEHSLNKVVVPGHKGPHPEAYHRAVADRIEAAVAGKSGQAYKDALQSELRVLGREIQTPGSALNKLVTKQ